MPQQNRLFAVTVEVGQHRPDRGFPLDHGIGDAVNRQAFRVDGTSGIDQLFKCVIQRKRPIGNPQRTDLDDFIPPLG